MILSGIMLNHGGVNLIGGFRGEYQYFMDTLESSRMWSGFDIDRGTCRQASSSHIAYQTRGSHFLSALYHSFSFFKSLGRLRSLLLFIKMRNLTLLLSWLVATTVTSASPIEVKTQNPAACPKVTFIFARGTGENGTMGGSVGPLMTGSLKRKFGDDNVVSKGVSYPADWPGAMSGAVNPKGAEGAKKMAEMTREALTECPTTNVVLGGYSQGAEQVHGALLNLGALGANVAVR
jgi:hypothetical protein